MISYFRHPGDDFKAAQATKNILGRWINISLLIYICNVIYKYSLFLGTTF